MQPFSTDGFLNNFKNLSMFVGYYLKVRVVRGRRLRGGDRLRPQLQEGRLCLPVHGPKL